MAERFSLDREGVRQLSRKLAEVRSESAGVRQQPEPGSLATQVVAAAMQQFGDAMSKAHGDFDSTLQHLTGWLDEVADEQLAVDDSLAQRLSTGHTSTRSDT